MLFKKTGLDKSSGGAGGKGGDNGSEDLFRDLEAFIDRQIDSMKKPEIDINDDLDGAMASKEATIDRLKWSIASDAKKLEELTCQCTVENYLLSLTKPF